MSFKVVFLGSSQSGKTSLMHRLTEGQFSKQPEPTIAPYLKITAVVVDGLEIKLQMWDTPGPEEYRGITEKCYDGAHAFIFMFNLTDQRSFDDVKVWLEQVKKSSGKKVCRIILGNKNDLHNKKVVDMQKIQEFIEEEDIKYFEVSAKTGENVEEALKHIATDLKRSFFRSKIVVVGSGPCGKTCFIQRLVGGTFPSHSMATIGTDYQTKIAMVDGSEIKFQVWDTPGNERSRPIINSSSYKGAHGVIIMIDLTKELFLDDIKKWLKDINCNNGEKACKIILGNKSDLQEERTSSRQEIRELIKEVKIPYFEISARTGENIEEAFLYLARDIKKTFFSSGNNKAINDEEKNTKKKSSDASKCNLF